MSDPQSSEDNQRTRYPRIPSQINVNVCYPDHYIDYANPNFGYYAYRTALHEAGHALGLSDFSVIRIAIGEGYEMSHPTVPDSVMNYNSDLGLSEPDCWPYPLDIMAVHALYQKVIP